MVKGTCDATSCGGRSAPPATQLWPHDLPDHINQWRKRPDANLPSWRTVERSCGSVSVRASSPCEPIARGESQAHSTPVCGADVMGRGGADGWQSRTRPRLSGGCKAQWQMLVSSGRIEVRPTITEHGRRVSPSREANHRRTPLQFAALT